MTIASWVRLILQLIINITNIFQNWFHDKRINSTNFENENIFLRVFIN